MPHNDFDPTKIPQVHRVVGAVFGFAFAGIGVILIGWLWLQPFGGFGSPPVIFRLVGSMVSLVFIAVGASVGIAALKGTGPHGKIRKFANRPPHRRAGGYKCPNCGAALSDDADVSPSGDVKCDYCRTWFNIHA